MSRQRSGAVARAMPESWYWPERMAARILRLDREAAGARLIETKYGIINPASIDSITLHKDLMEQIGERMRYQLTLEQATAEVLGRLPVLEDNKKALPQQT